MNLFITTLVIIVSFILFGFGIQQYFLFKVSQGKETSNAPIRKVITSILIAFLTMVGFPLFFGDIIVQLLNHIPGIHLKETQNSEIIGGLAFFGFCIIIGVIIFIYYRYRHQLYIKDDMKHTGSSKIFKSKNVVSNSKIKSEGNIHIGDSIKKKKK